MKKLKIIINIIKLLGKLDLLQINQYLSDYERLNKRAEHLNNDIYILVEKDQEQAAIELKIKYKFQYSLLRLQWHGEI